MLFLNYRHNCVTMQQSHTQFGAHVIVRKGELKSNIILNNPIQVLKDDFKIAHLISVGEL